MFNILNLQTQALVENGDGEPLAFSSGKDAAAFATVESEAQGVKFQVRPVRAINDANWREREQKRIDDGVYVVPESYLFTKTPDHFVHVSLDKPGCIAYTQSEEKGRADIQTRISVGAYLEKFAADSGEDNRTSALQWFDATFTDTRVKFATTPDEIESVYVNYDKTCPDVANSCMHYVASYFSSEIHPVRVYGAGDLAIAYLANDDNKTTHRALCWPEKKIYSRVYGKGDLLHSLLKKLGYAKGRYFGGEFDSFDGARLLKIADDNDSERYVMPFIDEDSKVSSRGKYFVLGGHEYTTGTTDGLTEETASNTCERCNDPMSEDEGYTVYLDARRRQSEQWCESCEQNCAFRCDGLEEVFSSDAVGHYDMENGETLSERYFHEHGATCERSGDNIPDDDAIQVREASYTVTWSQYTFERHGWTCEKTSEAHSDEDSQHDVIMAIMPGGSLITETWCDDAVESDAFEHDGKLYHNDLRDIVAPEIDVEAPTLTRENEKPYVMILPTFTPSPDQLELTFPAPKVRAPRRWRCDNSGELQPHDAPKYLVTVALATTDTPAIVQTWSQVSYWNDNSADMVGDEYYAGRALIAIRRRRHELVAA